MDDGVDVLRVAGQTWVVCRVEDTESVEHVLAEHAGRVVLVLAPGRDDLVAEAISRGARALVADMPSAVERDRLARDLERHGAHVDPRFVAPVLRLARAWAWASRPGLDLSEREQAVLARVAAGESNRAVAAHLYLSEHTVRNHLVRIYAKLGVDDRAAASALWHGEVERVALAHGASWPPPSD